MSTKKIDITRVWWGIISGRPDAPKILKNASGLIDFYGPIFHINDRSVTGGLSSYKPGDDGRFEL
jgi:hypothetical protein